MIFLVVSGGLLVSVLGTISGQQQKTRFQTGVRDFESQLQDTLNDVETGYYPNSAGNAGQTSGLIFLGKGIQFYKSPTTGENTSWRETTIQANAKVGSAPNQKDVTQLNEPGASVQSNNVLVDHELLNGVELTAVKYFDGTGFGTDSFGIAIVSGISSNGTKSNGSRGQLAKLDIVIPDDPTKAFLSNAISELDEGDPIGDASKGVVFCLREGGGGRPAAVALGLAPQGPGVVSTGQRNISTVYFDDEAENNFGCAI